MIGDNYKHKNIVIAGEIKFKIYYLYQRLAPLIKQNNIDRSHFKLLIYSKHYFKKGIAQIKCKFIFPKYLIDEKKAIHLF